VTQEERAPRHLLAVLVLFALVLTFWIYRVYVLAPTQVALLSADLVQYFVPSSAFVHDEIRAGRIPTWNPFQMAGYPFLAAQITGVLYPPQLILATLLSPARAHEAHALLHLTAAGFFTWLFVRRLGVGLWGGLASAAAFLLSYEMVHRTYNTPYLSTAIWLPAMFWTAHGLLSETRLRWAIGLGLVGALSFVGGNMQGTLYSAQAAAAFWCFGLWAYTPAGRRWQTLGLTAVAGGLAAALVAPQLLPTLELVREGARGLPGLDSEDASLGSVRLGVLWAGAVGWKPSNYVSPYALALFPLGLLDRERRAVWAFFCVTALLAILFIAGPTTPVWRIYYALPLGNLFRIPTRMAVVWAFSVSVLAGLGIHGLLSVLRTWLPNLPRLAPLVGALLALLVTADSFRRARLPDAVPVLWKAEDDELTGLSQFLDKRRGYDRVFIEDLHRFAVRETQAKIGTLRRKFVVPDYEPLVPRAYADLFGEDELWHGRLNLPQLRNDRRGVPPRLLDFMSVRDYVGSGHVEPFVRALFLRQVGVVPQRRGEILTARRSQAVPRTYAVGKVSVVPDTEQAREKLLDLAFDTTGEAIVSAGTPFESDPSATRVATIRSFANDEVVIDAYCAAECFVVLTDLHYPGWDAWVDGEPAEVWKTNLAFRGVRIEPGTRRIVFRYRPRAFWLGLAIAATGIVAVGAFAAVRVRRARAARRGRVQPDDALPQVDSPASLA
jgi:hypothetical protein